MCGVVGGPRRMLAQPRTVTAGWEEGSSLSATIASRREKDELTDQLPKHHFLPTLSQFHPESETRALQSMVNMPEGSHQPVTPISSVSRGPFAVAA